MNLTEIGEVFWTNQDIINEIDNFIQYRYKWHSKILDVLEAEFLSYKNHQPRKNDIQSLIDNKMDFIKIKDRQIDLDSNKFVFGNILLQQNSILLS